MQLSIREERWPLERPFAISRGTKTEAAVIVVELTRGAGRGRGECVPYTRYGETLESVAAQLTGLTVADSLSREQLATLLPPGAARNAVDCALWDLEAKEQNAPAWKLAGIPEPRPVATSYTVTLATPSEMHERAGELSGKFSTLKVKLGAGKEDIERLVAVRSAAPRARILIDANEGWSEEEFPAMLAACEAAGVALIEQPLSEGRDALLARIERTIPVCADESFHVREHMDAIGDRYDAVSVKLDKTGGLTEALAVMEAARTAGLSTMVGCMVSTSLSLAPTVLLAGAADFADLDGALLLKEDREPGLSYDGELVLPPPPQLWG